MSHNSNSSVPRRMPSNYSAVSPLDTPRTYGDLGSSESPDVSPIEALPNSAQQFPTQQQKARSQIPVLRKEAPDASATTNGRKADTRWDDFSGEPTTSDTGRPSAVKPGTQSIEYQYPDLKEKTRLILAGLRERQPGNKMGIGREPPPVQNDLDNPVQREPWRGASGRTALVEPVRNDPKARPGPIQIPAKSSRRFEPATTQALSDHTILITEEEILTPKSSTIRPVPSEEVEEAVKPPAPLRLGKNSPRLRSPVTAEFAKPLQSPFQSPQHIDTIHSSVTVPTGNSRRPLSPTNGPLTPATPTPTTQPPAIPPRSDSRQSTPTNSSTQLNLIQQQQKPDHLQPVQAVDPEHDPSSRFSWTTYATTVNDSPPGTPGVDPNAPPVPTLPYNITLTPLMMRKRPMQDRSQTVPQSNSDTAEANAKVVARKPTPADRRRTTDTLLTTASDLSKSLPQCPPEIEAVDKISTLEARMEEFARRKRNVNKLIKQLKTGGQPTHIAFNPRNQEERKRQIAGLESELADIVQEEHDVGLRLHRVQRKKDRDENYEKPTGLWIKRVTSYPVDMLT